MVMGVLMGLFPLLHIHEMYRCQSSIGQSFVGVIFWELGIATWLIYGILKKDRVIVIANWIAVSVGLCTSWQSVTTPPKPLRTF